LTLTKNPTAPTGVRARNAWEESMKRITYGMQRRACRCALSAKNRWSLALGGGLTCIALTASAKIHSAISCVGNQPVSSTAIPTTYLNILEHWSSPSNAHFREESHAFKTAIKPPRIYEDVGCFAAIGPD